MPAATHPHGRLLRRAVPLLAIASASALALSACAGGAPDPSARVEATVYAPGGATIVEQEARDLGDCGEYTVDFEFP